MTQEIAVSSLNDPALGRRAEIHLQYQHAVDLEKTISVISGVQKIRAKLEVLDQSVTEKKIELLPDSQQLFDALKGCLHKLNANSEEQCIASSWRLYQIAKAQEFKGKTEFLNQLAEINSDISHYKYLSDIPKLLADGLFRNFIYYQPTGNLIKSREHGHNLAPDLFDVIVMGGGPAGIAATYHLGSQGIDTLLLESGYCAQAMSDARASSVHTMRTNVQYSSIAGVPDLACSHQEVSMQALMEKYPIRALAEEARQFIISHCGHRFDAKFAETADLESPVARAEVFAYFNQVLAEAANFDSVNILEQSPVISCTRGDDGFIRIETARGEVFRAKKIILSSGFVGPLAEFGRILDDSAELERKHPEQIIVLKDEHSLYEHGDRILAHLQALTKEEKLCLPFINESVLGHHEIRTMIRLQPPGTRLAIVGSGETAVKCVLELLSLNPNIKVDLFTKAPLEPNDAQSPAYYQAGPKLLRCLVDSDFARTSVQLRAPFGSPVTYETLSRILELSQEGKVRVFELGAHFGEKDLDLTYDPAHCSLNIRVDVNSTRVKAALCQQYHDWQEHGLDASWLKPIVDGGDFLSEVNGPTLVCAGYDNIRSRKQTIEAKGISYALSMISDEDGTITLSNDNLTSAKDPDVAFAGAVATFGYSDTGFYGGALRAALAANVFARTLKAHDENPLAQLQSLVPTWREADQQRYAELLTEESTPSIFSGTPGIERLFAEHQAGTSLTHVQSLLLSRALRLKARMHGALKESLVKAEGQIEE